MNERELHEIFQNKQVYLSKLQSKLLSLIQSHPEITTFDLHIMLPEVSIGKIRTNVNRLHKIGKIYCVGESKRSRDYNMKVFYYKMYKVVE